MRSFAAAMGFLTRVPSGVHATGGVPPAASVPWFPVVGALVGGAVAGVYAAGTEVFPPLVAGLLGIGAGVLLTGALHEDGLADSADAFGGSHDRDSTLRILRDPRVGTYGAVAIALSVLTRGAGVASLQAWDALAALVAAHALSRAAAVGVLGAIEPAADDGLGATYGRLVGPVRAVAGVGIGVGIGVVALGLAGLGAAALAGISAGWVASISRRRIGGVTGDVLGAIQQLAETLILLFATALAWRGWDLAWWR